MCICQSTLSVAFRCPPESCFHLPGVTHVTWQSSLTDLVIFFIFSHSALSSTAFFQWLSPFLNLEFGKYKCLVAWGMQAVFVFLEVRKEYAYKRNWKLLSINLFWGLASINFHIWNKAPVAVWHSVWSWHGAGCLYSPNCPLPNSSHPASSFSSWEELPSLLSSGSNAIFFRIRALGSMDHSFNLII